MLDNPIAQYLVVFGLIVLVAMVVFGVGFGLFAWGHRIASEHEGGMPPREPRDRP